MSIIIINFKNLQVRQIVPESRMSDKNDSVLPTTSTAADLKASMSAKEKMFFILFTIGVASVALSAVLDLKTALAALFR